MFLAPEILAEEKKNERISAAITAAIVIVFFLISLLYTVYRFRVPPPGQKYEVLGAIDFGDMKQGSRKVNNFERAVPDPAEVPPSTPKPQPKETPPPTPKPTVPAVADPTPTPPPQVTTPKPAPVSQPDPPKVEKPKPTPKPPAAPTSPPKETKPQETKDNSQTTTTTPAPPAADPSDKPSTSDKPAGSNQGNETTGTGNAGTPDTKTLDPNGLYSFGSGTGGLKGRSAVSLAYPVYNVQEEGELEFEFYINPDGSVAFAKVVGLTNKPGLKEAGIDAIMTWRFSSLPPGQSGRQTVRVKIKFKLRG